MTRDEIVTDYYNWYVKKARSATESKLIFSPSPEDGTKSLSSGSR